MTARLCIEHIRPSQFLHRPWNGPGRGEQGAAGRRGVVGGGGGSARDVMPRRRTIQPPISIHSRAENPISMEWGGEKKVGRGLLTWQVEPSPPLGDGLFFFGSRGVPGLFPWFPPPLMTSRSGPLPPARSVMPDVARARPCPAFSRSASCRCDRVCQRRQLWPTVQTGTLANNRGCFPAPGHALSSLGTQVGRPARVAAEDDE